VNARVTDKTIVTDLYIGERTTTLAGLAVGEATHIAPDLPAGEPLVRMGYLNAAIAEAVAAAIGDGRRPVSLAVDCCSAIGVWAGLQRAGLRPALLWFDAHGDFNDWTTSPSGFLGGMPLAMLVGRGEQTLMTAAGAAPMSEDRVWLADARDLDPGEREALSASAVHHVGHVADLLRPGAIPEGPLWVHFDVDVVDPAEMEAVNYPAPGGPGAAEVRRVFRGLALTGRVAAVSLSSWDGRHAAGGRSGELSMSLLSELLHSPHAGPQ
jgi:arginase